MKSISVLGCGWLGLPLAKKLIDEGFFVKGTTTSKLKVALLEKEQIEAFIIELHEEKIVGDLVSFLQSSDYLIIDIPPKIRALTAENFVQKIKNLIPYIQESSVKHVIFISSTSVYNDENKTVREEDAKQPLTESGKQLVQIEQMLLSNSYFQTTVLRFGGLIGTDRHPIHYLSGKKGLENPLAPINLIHQEDCISIILKIISQQVWGQIFNAVAPFHPNRKTYYTEKAKTLRLELPEFDESKPSVGKTVSSDKLIRILNYDFKKLE